MLVVEADREIRGFASLGPQEGRVDETDVGELYALNLDPQQREDDVLVRVVDTRYRRTLTPG